MKLIATLALVAGSLALTSSVGSAQDEATTSPGVARATIMNASGHSIGTATLIQTPHGLLIRAVIESLEPGPHGVHVHETGKCDSADGFKSAGGHFNPASSAHGYEAEGGTHAGDLANQTAGADGKMVVELFNSALSLTDGQAALLDSDGAALVVHATADDYRSQPSGNSGDRVACGVVKQG